MLARVERVNRVGGQASIHTPQIRSACGGLIAAEQIWGAQIPLGDEITLR
jgi:hypothetical protein